MMSPRIPFLAVLAFLLFSSTALAQGPIVAVFDLEDRGSGLAQGVLDNLTDYLSVLLAESGYQVIPRDKIRERIEGEQAETFKECYDQSCRIEMGRELAAQKILAARILKIADTCQLTATLYDLRRSATEKAASSEATCDEKSLLGALKTIASKLALKTPEEPEKKPVSAPVPVPVPAPVSVPVPVPVPETKEALPSSEESKPARDTFSFIIGIKGGVIMPSLGDKWTIYIYKSEDESEDLDLETDPGIWLDAYFDYRCKFPLNLGVYMTFFNAQAPNKIDRLQKTNFGFLAVGGRIKFRSVVSDTVVIRPGGSIGFGTVVNGDEYRMNISDAPLDVKGFKGLAMGANVECAWYVTERFGLVFDLGMVIFPAAQKSEGDYTYKMNFAPLLYVAVGGEFGL
jgi:hypothetical protein